MKYSELKSYLELAHWENESDDDYIKVYRNGYTVAVVGLWEQYNIRILDPTQMTEGLYRRLSDFAKTPLVEREEEKRYWLQKIPVPLLDKEGEKKWLWKYTGTAFSNVFGADTIKVDSKLYQTIFTESEIAEMDITGFEEIEVTP